MLLKKIIYNYNIYKSSDTIVLRDKDRHYVIQQGVKIVQEVTAKEFRCGLRAGVPIAVGYLPIAITFGLLSRSSGIPSCVAIAMSLLVFAGASQFVGVELMGIGASPLGVVLTTFILNFRHFLMTSSISQRVDQRTPRKLMALLAFGVTDETFAVASLKKEKIISPYYLLGLNFIAFGSWVIGTCIGVFLVLGLPDFLVDSMGIALYAMFIGLLVPSMKASRPVLIVALIAMTINLMFNYISVLSSFSHGWSIIISTVFAAFMGAALFSNKGRDG